MQALSLVVLISGSGSNLQAIIDSIKSGDLNAEIRAVISNRPNAYGLERARNNNIPAVSLDHTLFESREQFDLQLQQTIDQYQPDIIVLAGYMRILSADIINHFFPRMINIHPSLLPKYQGLNTHQRALDNLDKEHGVSIHIVTPELDAGPVIIQGLFDIESDDDSDSLQHKAHKLEHQMYPLVLKWLSRKQLEFRDGLVVYKQETLNKPLIFNELD